MFVADWSRPYGQLNTKPEIDGRTDKLTGGFTVTVVIPAGDTHLPTLAVTLYSPDAVWPAFVMGGFWFVEINAFGPVQL